MIGIPGEIDLPECRGPSTGITFPFVARCLANSPFWNAMLACAADEPSQFRDWGSYGDDRTGMGWRRGVVAATARSLARTRDSKGGKAWGHEIVAADLAPIPGC